MTDTIQNHDFIEIEYTGRIKNDGTIFDTTDEKLAKTEGIHNEKMVYGPLVICIGEAQILKGLDAKLEGKEIGKKYTIDLTALEGFGKKDSSLLKLIPSSAFKKQNVPLMPGLQINIDGTIGTIRTVAGGRVIVDFNHPLSGKDIVYEVKILRKITDDKEKAHNFLMLQLNIKKDMFTADVKDKKAVLGFKTDVSKFPEELKKMVAEKLKELIGITSVEYKDISKEEAKPKAHVEDAKKHKDSKHKA